MKKAYSFLLVIIASIMPWSMQASILTNNYNIASSTIGFYNSAHALISSVPSIPAWGSITIPQNTYNTRVQQLPQNNTFSFLVNGNDMNMYTNNIITNNTTSTFILYWYPAIPGTGNPFGGILTINPGQSLPIGTGTTSMSVANQAQSVTYISQQPIANNTSYIINGSTSFTMTAYTPTLTNNYVYEATNLSFYDSNSNLIPTIYPTIAANGGIIYIPSNASFSLLNYFGSNNLTIPIFYPYQNIFTENTITNNAPQAVGITYYGTVNGISNIALNSTPIPINLGMDLPIITGALNVSVFDTNNNPLITEFELQSGVSYFINYDNGTWSLGNISATYALSNNDTQAVSNLIFYNTNNMQLGLIIPTLLAGDSTNIPVNSVYCTCTDQSINVTVALPSDANSNLVGTGTLTNNSTAAVTANYYGTINNNASTLLNETPFNIAAGANIPIITGASAVIVYVSGSPVVNSTPISANTSYFINDNNDAWVVSTSSTSYQLTNNYTQTAYNISFYNSNLIIQGTALASLAAGDNTPIPTNAVIANATDLGADLQFVVSGNTYSNIFTSNSITNNASVSINIIYYGMINNIPNTLLNTTPITVAPGIKSPIITGATTANIYITSSDELVISAAPINTSINYFVNEDNDVWTFQTFAATYAVINNYTQPISDLSFFDTNTLQVGSTISTLLPGDSTNIPETSVYYVCTDFGTNLTLALPTDANSNLINTGTLTNNSTTAVTVNYYGTINNIASTLLNETPVTIAAGANFPIVTGASAVSVYLADSLVVTNTPIFANSPYFINDNNGAWVVSTSSTSYQLTNNYTQSAAEITFYNTNFIVQGIPLGSLGAGNTTPIPTTAVAATFNEFATTIQLNVAGNSSLYTNAKITNSTTFPVTINYYGDILDFTDALLNVDPITVDIKSTIPIITGTANITVYTSGSTPVIMNAIITPNTNYYINYNIENDIWSFDTFAANYPLINNYNQTISSITFYDNSQSIITTMNSLSAWDTAQLPSNTASVLIDQPYTQTQSSNFFIEIPSKSSVNIYSDYVVTNSTTNSIIVTCYYFNGTSTLESGQLTIDAGLSMQIITGTTALAVFDMNNNPLIPQTSILQNSSYIIDSTPSLTPYVPQIFNNGPNATDLNFYTSNKTLITMQQSFTAQSSKAIPGNTNFATLNDFSSTLNINTTFMPLTLPVFTNSTITNIANQTVYATFYGSLNGLSAQVLNPAAIAIASGASIPIITGANYVSATAGNIVVIEQTNVIPNTSYFINEETINGVDTWTCTSTIPLSSASIINNTGQAATNFQFFNANNYPLATNEASSIPSGTSLLIPATATTATFTETFNTIASIITIPLSDTATSYIFEPYVINNASQYIINLMYYSNLNGSTTLTPLNTNEIPVTPTLSNQIITGAQAVSVFVNEIQEITQYPLIANQSYYVIYTGTQWIISINPPLTPYLFTNNYDLNATQLIFKDINNNQTESPLPNFNAYSDPVAIPLTTTNATLNDFGSTLSIPLLDTQSSSLITPNVITNNTGQQIGVTYYGTINDKPTQYFNTPAIVIPEALDCPILTNAQTYSIVDSNGITRIDQAPIGFNTSYVINDDWTPPTPIEGTAALTNNSDQSATYLTFYNNSMQVGTITNPFSIGMFIDIPTSATKASVIQSFNNSNATLTVPVSHVASSNLVINNPSNDSFYTLNNNSAYTITVILYGLINTIPDSPLTNPAISIAPGQSVPILTGTENISVIFNSDTVIDFYPTSSNSSYFINNPTDVWSINSYPSIATLYNNNASATDLKFFDEIETQIGTTITSFPSQTSVATPINCVYATMIVYGSTITIPVLNNALTNVFTMNTINNNTQDTIDLIFNGIINESIDPVALNNPAFSLLTTITTPIPTGSQTVYLVQNDTTYTLDQNVSYYINYSNGAWSLNSYGSSAILTNNYNLPITHLVFNNASNTTPSTPQSVGAADFVAIPTNSTTAQFTDFNTISLTIPVSGTTSSNIFVASTINNTTSQPIGITFYGTMNEIPNEPFNESPINIQENTPINILKYTTSLTITVDNVIVIDTSTLIQPLPINISYDIDFSNNTWSIVPQILTLTNNCNEQATSVTYYNSDESIVPSSYTTMQPWATIPIPTNAVSAAIQYPSGTLTIYLSTETSSKVFVNSLLINNTTNDFYIMMHQTFNNINIAPLNDTPIFLQAGDSFPFISGTSNITIIANNVPILSNYPLPKVESYEIQITPNSSIKYNSVQLRAITESTTMIQPSSSAIGVIRFLGGSALEATTSPVINLYAQNSKLFSEFLYVNFYAQVIADTPARTATIASVNDIITTYASNYANQPNFNYISSFYLINSQLLAAKTILLAAFPNSDQEINQFFDYVQERISSLLV